MGGTGRPPVSKPKKPGDPDLDEMAMASWPPVAALHNKTLRVAEAMTDDAPHVWLVIEEPPSFDHPGGREAPLFVPLGQVGLLRDWFVAVLDGDSVEQLPMVCAYDRTVSLVAAQAGDGLGVSVTFSTDDGRCTAFLPGGSARKVVDQLGWLAENHYHLAAGSQPPR